MDEPGTSPSASRDGALRPWEEGMIEVFVRAVDLVGLPRSIGEIYGFLYCRRQPQTFDDLMAALKISKGSVSQGLKLLRQLGAVQVQYVAGSRRDHYVPELSMKRLVSGFFKEQFTPHLESGDQRLRGVRQLLEEEPDDQTRAHGRKRVETLETWQRRMRRLLPVIRAVLGGAALLDPESAEKEQAV